LKFRRIHGISRNWGAKKRAVKIVSQGRKCQFGLPIGKKTKNGRARKRQEGSPKKEPTQRTGGGATKGLGGRKSATGERKRDLLRKEEEDFFLKSLGTKSSFERRSGKNRKTKKNKNRRRIADQKSEGKRTNSNFGSRNRSGYIHL